MQRPPPVPVCVFLWRPVARSRIARIRSGGESGCVPVRGRLVCFRGYRAAGIPGAGLIMMALVFGAVGVPLETIAFVAGVDRIMDMMRTTTNVSGDAAVATTVAVMTGEIDTREMISADDV